jgi:hypothetical protein
MVSFSQPSVRGPSASASACSTKVFALLSSAACRRLLGLPVPLRWRSAHASRLSAGRWSWLPQQETPRLPSSAARGKVLPLSRRSAMASHVRYPVHPGSSLSAFEATIEHDRAVLHKSLCFSCAAHLPFVEHARSAHLLVRLAIKARARRFTSAA